MYDGKSQKKTRVGAASHSGNPKKVWGLRFPTLINGIILQYEGASDFPVKGILYAGEGDSTR